MRSKQFYPTPPDVSRFPSFRLIICENIHHYLPVRLSSFPFQPPFSDSSFPRLILKRKLKSFETNNDAFFEIFFLKRIINREKRMDVNILPVFF